MKHFKLLLLSFFFSEILYAQDIHFSQFYAAPLQLNPAYTGVFNGNIRTVLNYRNQWQSFSPYNTFAGSLDFNFGQNMLKHDLFGVGVSFFSDKAGDSEFSTTQGNVSLSYIKTLGNKYSRNYLTVGFQGGFAQRSINPANLTFGSQYNGYAYDGTIESGETIALNSFTFLDLGAGLSWLYVPKNGINFYAGLAYHHLNEPDQSFYGTGDYLYMRTSVNAGAQIPLNDYFDILPAFLVQIQGPHYEFMGGLHLKYNMETKASQDQALSFGLWHRMGLDELSNYQIDASVISLRYEIFGLSAGLSYDINISALSDATNSLGGPELSLIYAVPLPHRDRKVDCPKF